MKTYNTGETNQDLKEKYNPEGSTLRKAQLRMLEMLKYIDKICKTENIDYQLNAGNVLGAVRHGGFIPWDDDVDIIVPYKDYKRLCKYLEEHPHPQFKLQNHKSDSHFYNFWNVFRDLKSEYIQDNVRHNVRKFRGLQIDIFPIHKGYNLFLHKAAAYLNYKLILKHIEKKRWHRIEVGYCVLNYVIFPLFYLLSYFVGDKKVWYHAYGQSWHFRYNASFMFPSKDLKFEDSFFKGPADVVAYLNEEYKDIPFNELPPVDKRDNHQAQYKVWD